MYTLILGNWFSENTTLPDKKIFLYYFLSTAVFDYSTAMLKLKGNCWCGRLYNHHRFLVFSLSGLLSFILIGLFINFQTNQQSIQVNSNSRQTQTTVPQSIVNVSHYLYQTKRSKVVLAAYMRSGSSITARILEENPDTFYVFEPLLTVETLRKFFLTAAFIDQPMRIMRRDDDTMENILENFLNCDLREINLETLAQFHMDKSSSTRDFYYCSHTTTARQWRYDCFKPFNDLCLSKRYSMVKTIRVKIASLEKLLAKDPNIKLVHLIRDPRAITASKIASWPANSLSKNLIDAEMKQSARLCRTMLENLKASEVLFTKFSDQVKVLVYERFAKSPIETTKKLYDFVGFQFTPKIAGFVDTVTHAGSPTPCPLCTSQRNSHNTSLKWRTSFNIEQVHMFDQHCLEVFQKAGFTRFQTQEELVNFNLVSWQYVNQPANVPSIYI